MSTLILRLISILFSQTLKRTTKVKSHYSVSIYYLILAFVSCSYDTSNKPIDTDPLQLGLLKLQEGIVDTSIITFADSPQFKWFMLDTSCKKMMELIHGVKFNYKSIKDKQTNANPLSNYKKEYTYSVAITDLNNDNILGIAIMYSGENCCGMQHGDIRHIHENGGMLDIGHPWFDHEPIPSFNELVFSHGREPLKRSKITAYKDTSDLPACFYLTPKVKRQNLVRDVPKDRDENLGTQAVIDSSNTSLSFLFASCDSARWRDILFESPLSKQRLVLLIGEQNYNFIRTKVFVGPAKAEIKDGLYRAWAMQPHSGGDPGCLILVDDKKNVFYVGIRRNKKIDYFSEDGSPMPEQMKKWTKEV